MFLESDPTLTGTHKRGWGEGGLLETWGHFLQGDVSHVGKLNRKLVLFVKDSLVGYFSFPVH